MNNLVEYIGVFREHFYIIPIINEFTIYFFEANHEKH